MKRKEVGIAYLLWALLGLIGGHKFYMGQTLMGIIYLFTGGLFGIGWLWDVFFLARKVRKHNEKVEGTESDKRKEELREVLKEMK